MVAGAFPPSQLILQLLRSQLFSRSYQLKRLWGGTVCVLAELPSALCFASTSTVHFLQLCTEVRSVQCCAVVHFGLWSCRFLQRKFDEGGASAVGRVLPEVLDALTELMVDPFGAPPPPSLPAFLCAHPGFTQPTPQDSPSSSAAIPDIPTQPYSLDRGG